MEFVQTAISAVVVAAVGIVLARLANQRFEALELGLAQFRDEVRGDLFRLESRLDGRIDRLESRLDGRIDGLTTKIDALDAKFDIKIDALEATFDTKVDSLRTDLTQIALAVGAAPRRETG